MAHARGCEAEVHYDGEYPATVVTDAAEAGSALVVAGEVLGEHRTRLPADPITGA